MILAEKQAKNIFGIMVTRHIFITHLLFVDDVLQFGKGESQEWLNYLG